MSRLLLILLPLLSGALLAASAQAEVATVSLPDTVNIYETFEVKASGPGVTGDMLRFADTNGKILGGSYAYLGNARNGILRLTAPVEPGEYQVVYLSNREVVARHTLRVNAVTAELKGPDSAEINARITVQFRGPRNQGDYLQITDADGKPVRGLYAYVGNAKSDEVTLRVTHADGSPVGSYGYTEHNPGSVTLRAPESPGEYRVVYLTAHRAIGEATLIVEDISATLTAPKEVPGAERFRVQWRFALRVFGHREAGACRTDLEIPLAPLNRASAGAAISTVQAMNLAKTPIAASLAQTENDLRDVSGERLIILLTDGEETCDGNPADVIAGLRTRGVILRINEALPPETRHDVTISAACLQQYPALGSPHTAASAFIARCLQ